MTKVYIVSDNNQTDGECGHIIGLTFEYETALRLKREHIEMHEKYDRQTREKFSSSNFVSSAVRYPHNIEITEKEIV